MESTTDPLNQSEYYAYDAASNMSSHKNASGGTTDYTYDALNRRTAVVYPDATYNYFAYDAVANMTKAQDSRGWSYFSYRCLCQLAHADFGAFVLSLMKASYSFCASLRRCLSSRARMVRERWPVP